MKRYIPSLALILCLFFAHAQGDAESNREQFITWDLKIYVVLAVLFIILTFLIVFLFNIERRLKTMEQKQKS
ncbi:MAG: hypothetical protein IPP77_06575 [Bacteroidetes bacterium]|nr:hypothetical protein [Bacteroidota bacterium]